MPLIPILLVLAAVGGVGFWLWSSANASKSAAPPALPPAPPAPSPGYVAPTPPPISPGAPVPMPNGPPPPGVVPGPGTGLPTGLDMVSTAIPGFALLQHYPGTGAWQNNTAYITAYQTALKVLAQVYNQPSWDPGKIDGKYGPATSAAVSAFEKFAHLPVDGQAGSTVANSILQAFSAASAATVAQALSATQLAGTAGFGDAIEHLAGTAAAQATGHAGGLGGFGDVTEEVAGLAVAQAGADFLVGYGGRGGSRRGVTMLEHKPASHVRGFAHAGAKCKWKSFKSAPQPLKNAFMAAARAMALDPSVTLGDSEHVVNGVRVRVSKPAPGHLFVTSYCSG